MKSALLRGTFLYFFILISIKAIGQDFSYGDFSQEEINLKSYSKDAAAPAVILNKFGRLTYSTGRGPIHLLHQTHVKIKIFKPDGYAFADLKLPLAVWENGEKETVSKFKALVYSPDERGRMIKTECYIDGAHYVDADKHTRMFVYALPNVKNGSIIEYSYEIDTPDITDYTPWAFQGAVPVLHSEYHVHFPKGQNYRVELKGNLKLSKNLLIKAPNCGDHDFFWNCSKVMYAMDSIPAFVPEDRMVAIVDYVPALYFPRVHYSEQYKRASLQYISTWSDIDKTLRQYELFGKKLKEQSYFKRLLSDQVSGISDTLLKAQAIYQYINHHMKWNNFYGAYSTGLQKAFKASTGSVGDINLSLICALRAHKIYAEPVLLSTKRNGQIVKEYPTLKGFDYVVALVNINKRKYLIDATDPLLPFGMLPEACLNDQGRVLPDRDSSYWVDLKWAYKKNTSYIANLTLNADGSLAGEVKNYTWGYDAFYKRKEIQKFNSVDEYLESIGATINKAKITKSYINNADSLNLPLCETFVVDIPKSVLDNNSQLLFNPYFLNRISENPFKLSERIYPIDCGPPSEQRFIMTLIIPENYSIYKIPDAVSLALPNKGGSFYTSYEQNDNKLTVSHIVQLNKDVYTAEEYPYLKELFNKIIQIQKADIILKRK